MSKHQTRQLQSSALHRLHRNHARVKWTVFASAPLSILLFLVFIICEAHHLVSDKYSNAVLCLAGGIPALSVIILIAQEYGFGMTAYRAKVDQLFSTEDLTLLRDILLSTEFTWAYDTKSIWITLGRLLRKITSEDTNVLNDAEQVYLWKLVLKREKGGYGESKFVDSALGALALIGGTAVLAVMQPYFQGEPLTFDHVFYRNAKECFRSLEARLTQEKLPHVLLRSASAGAENLLCPALQTTENLSHALLRSSQTPDGL